MGMFYKIMADGTKIKIGGTNGEDNSKLAIHEFSNVVNTESSAVNEYMVTKEYVDNAIKNLVDAIKDTLNVELDI